MIPLCLSLQGKTLGENIALLKELKGHFDLAEIRADYLQEDQREELASFPARLDVPAILSCRRAREGGGCTSDEPTRLSLLEEGLKGSYAYLDLESDCLDTGLEEQGRAKGTRIIRSFYCRGKIPPELPALMKDRADRGEIPRVVMGLETSREQEELLTLSRRLEGIDEYLLLGEGAFGSPARILAGKLGAAFTYCTAAVTADREDEFPVEVMDELYRVREIDRETAVFGIIGNPVMHSKSPAIHNPGFSVIGMKAVYLPFPTDDPEAFFRLSRELDIRGFSVTMPFKNAVLPFLHEMTEGVAAVKSCNTVVRRGDRWWGCNTDVEGFLFSLDSWFPRGLSSVKTAVLGAGGAAGAIVYGLVSRGADVTVYNRTTEKALQCAEKYGCSWGSLRDFHREGDYPLIIQATGVGMHPHEESDPAPDYRFSGREAVVDIIYYPEETRFLRRAREAGCRTMNGLAMLKAQGVLQFRLFTGREYPPDL
ncbi:MAG: shikimate dehydrogenase [Spirochaetales bacterium]|nr:shikimate dehydrogenase [Spirochaetales bacterium]